MSLETLLIVKLVISVVVVLFLSYIAEYSGAKWAGIISGLPTGSSIMLYFYAYENGLSFASESALYNMMGLVAMQAFIYGYYVSNQFSRNPGVLLSSLIGLLFYLPTAALISCITVTPTLALIVSSISFFVFIRLFDDIEPINIKNKIALKKNVLIVRSILSGAIIVFITTLAYLMGSQWSGIFSAFPTTLYPLIVILHLNYGKKIADSVIKFVPKGLGGLLIYSFVIHTSYKSTGLNTGVFLAFMGTASYLLIFLLLEKRFKTTAKIPKSDI